MRANARVRARENRERNERNEERRTACEGGRESRRVKLRLLYARPPLKIPCMSASAAVRSTVTRRRTRGCAGHARGGGAEKVWPYRGAGIRMGGAPANVLACGLRNGIRTLKWQCQYRLLLMRCVSDLFCCCCCCRCRSRCLNPALRTGGQCRPWRLRSSNCSSRRWVRV